MEAAQAEIIAASFGDGCREGIAEGFFEERQVDVVELLLQIDGAGGDDDAGVVLKAPEQRRNEIGEGFSGAGAGFDERVLVGVEGLLDAVEHFHLLRAVLEVGLHLRENAARREKGFGAGKSELWSQAVVGKRQIDIGKGLGAVCRCGFFGDAEEQIAHAVVAAREEGFLLATVGDGHFMEHKGIARAGVVENAQENLGADDGVVQRAVVIGVRNVQMGGDGHELVARERRQEKLGHVVAVEPDIVETAAELKFDAALVERKIVSQQQLAVDEREKFFFDLGPGWRICDHVVGDAGHDGDVFRDAFLRFDETLPGAGNAAVFNDGETDFDDLGVVVQAGRFHIDGDKIFVLVHDHRAQLLR